MVITIKDIAEKLGLSYSSVSRALNNKAGVSDETRKAVVKVASDLGYSPNELARSLVGKSSNTIGVVLPDIKNSYFSEVLQGILEGASEANLTCVFCISNWSKDREKQYIAELQQKRINGIILKRTNDYTEYTQKDIAVPAVIIENRSSDSHFGYVEVDNHLGATIATKHLLDCGYKNIAFVGGLKNARSCVLRHKGYAEVLKSSGFEYVKERVSFGEFTLDSGYHQTKALFEKRPEIDAFFGSNDVISLGVLKYLHERQIHVPEQIGVIGFDNIQLSDYPTIGLTTISQPTNSIGRSAFNLLYEQIQGSPPHRVIFQPELVLRGTTRKR